MRWAGINGPLGATLGPVGLQPGDYTEIGGRFNAFYSLSNEFSTVTVVSGARPYLTKAPAAAAQSGLPDVILGANIMVSERYYLDEVVIGGTAERQNTTVSPGASIILAHLFQYQNTLRLDYSYIHDNSNDITKSFVDNVVTLTAIRGF